MDYSIRAIKLNKSVSDTKIKKISKLLLNKEKITIKKLVKSNDVQHLPAKFFVAKSFKREAQWICCDNWTAETISCNNAWSGLI